MNRLGYLLNEEDTDKVLHLAQHLEINPNAFMDHCITVLWEAYTSER